MRVTISSHFVFSDHQWPAQSQRIAKKA